MKGAFLFGLFSALVGGGAMAATLASSHALGHFSGLVWLAAGGCGLAGLTLGLLGYLIGRPK